MNRELPPWFVLRAAEQPRFGPLAMTASMLADETARPGLGSDAIVGGLVECLFAYLLREMVQQRGAAGSGWSHAVHDQPVGRAVALMHADCARAWTLDALAQAVGMSRTALAERFRNTMNDTPLNHLRTVRIQRAMWLLTEGDGRLEEVAAAVGYQDAFGFSKAFKRLAGVAPGEFRRRDRAERSAPWRFGP